METRGRVTLADDTDLALETSLVEWKLFSPSCGLWPLKTLETSLVEWKHVFPLTVFPDDNGLGNFLSGMETHPQSAPGRVPATPWKLP